MKRKLAPSWSHDFLNLFWEKRNRDCKGVEHFWGRVLMFPALFMWYEYRCQNGQWLSPVYCKKKQESPFLNSCASLLVHTVYKILTNNNYSLGPFKTLIMKLIHTSSFFLSWQTPHLNDDVINIKVHFGHIVYIVVSILGLFVHSNLYIFLGVDTMTSLDITPMGDDLIITIK